MQNKDFSQFLDSKQNHSDYRLDDQEMDAIFNKSFEIKAWQLILANVVSTISLNFLTSPITVLYTHMQLSPKPIYDQINNLKEIMESSLTMNQKRKLELILKYNHSPYQPFTCSNYRTAMKGIAEQGIQGFFKGLMTGVIHTVLNSQIRYFLIQQYNSEKKGIQLAYTSGIAGAIDFITNPLMMIQSRFILQNRLPNMATYPTILSLLRQVPMKDYYKGAGGHILKNLSLLLGQIPSVYIENNRLSLTYLLGTQQLITYPFITVIRRMHCQSSDTFMLRNNYNNIVDGFRQIVREEGIFKLYNGFGAFACANIFISLVLYSTQLLGEAED